MTELERYLAEEIAEDHADGLITRREALHKLGLLGLSLTAAGSLLAAFPRRARSAPLAAATPALTAAVVPTRMVTFRGPGGRRLIGAWAPATEARGGLLVIHENRGLTEHIRSVAGRFAANGYSALAIDLLSEKGGTAKIGDEDAARAALAGVAPSRFVADMKAGLTELGRRLPGKRLAALGFCFGGAMVWSLLASKDRRLAAAAPFYGPFPDAPAWPARRRPCSRSTAASTTASTERARRTRGAEGRRRAASARHLPRRRPCVLQRRGPAVRRGRRRGGGEARARLVRRARRRLAPRDSPHGFHIAGHSGVPPARMPKPGSQTTGALTNGLPSPAWPRAPARLGRIDFNQARGQTLRTSWHVVPRWFPAMHSLHLRRGGTKVCTLQAPTFGGRESPASCSLGSHSRQRSRRVLRKLAVPLDLRRLCVWAGRSERRRWISAVRPTSSRS
jgi:carboxymethylenebutenolidase